MHSITQPDLWYASELWFCNQHEAPVNQHLSRAVCPASLALDHWQQGWQAIKAVLFPGLTLMFLSKERRRTLALYMLARLAQCLYNSLKQRGLFHFWGSDWAYGDALLFALSSAQVLPGLPCPSLSFCCPPAAKDKVYEEQKKILSAFSVFAHSSLG